MAFREDQPGHFGVCDRFEFRDELSPRAERVLSDYDCADLENSIDLMLDELIPRPANTDRSK